jgi:amino acid transporter
MPDALVPALPEPLGYKLKRKLLGEPLNSNELEHQRLGIPTAMAIFSSDNISSSAYATEEILHVLIPFIGILAFSLVIPITVAMLVVLTFLILSYRETIKEYPTAGGAYMVTRDNFGYKPALVAGVSLLTDYILTVAVSASAGIAALTSLVPALQPYHLELALFVVALIAYVNLRGVKESGKVFMIPTYLFMLAMAAMISAGLYKLYFGSGLAKIPPKPGSELLAAGLHGSQGVSTAVLYGAGLWVVLKAFASAGTAVTGVEAISNGVSAFHKPEWKHARRTLVLMGLTLAVCFLGLSFLATKVWPSPYLSGSPTVISQVGKAVFGPSPGGHVLYVFLQGSTLLILTLAANTSFADFPRLANFAAGDSYMPRQLMKRGQRLVFSNGILLLAGCAMALMIATNASVSRLIPFYAVGVFTSFTMSQAGMTKHHLTKKEKGWQKGVFINGIGCALSFVVDIIFMATKFRQGAWFILVLVPVLVVLLVRMNRQYVEEETELKEEVAELAGRPILRRHVVYVMVDQLNRATARALQYARSLTPDEIRAVHFAIDEQRARELTDEWRKLGLTRIPLHLVECPDRRVARAALETAAEASISGDTEVTVLLPRLEYRRAWHRLLHDRTGNEIAEALGDLPRVNVTFVPYHLTAGRHPQLTAADVLGPDVRRPAGTAAAGPVGAAAGPRAGSSKSGPALIEFDDGDDALEAQLAALSGKPTPAEPGGGIEAARFRQHVVLEGRIKSLRVQPWSGVATLEATLADKTGAIQVVFLGRRTIAGLEAGKRIRVEGVVGQHRGRLALLNPTYRLLSDS